MKGRDGGTVQELEKWISGGTKLGRGKRISGGTQDRFSRCTAYQLLTVLIRPGYTGLFSNLKQNDEILILKEIMSSVSP